MLNRTNNVEALMKASHNGDVYDLIVIGGGATGLGSAVDAAARGLKVLLVEKFDFAKGTSSRATKLAHGGVRYLAQGNISLVREALEERGRMLRNAPNLVKPLAFVIPVRSWFDKLFYWIGLKVYDLLAGKLGVGPTTMMNRDAVVQALPTVGLKGLSGGVRYYDAQFDDARMAIALMKTLHRQGGMAVNYMPVVAFQKEGDQITGVTVKDELAGGAPFTLKAKAVINATGVWVDELRQMDNPSAKPMLSPSQGVHVTVDEHFYPAKDALMVPKTPDGRVLFVVPWLGKTLIGTTDTARRDAPFEPNALPGEIDFVLSTAGQYLAKAPTREDVRSVFVGLRPLVSQGEVSNTKSISREHTIVTETSGLVTITGGKWTTYRAMAEEVVDLVCQQQGWTNPCQTRDLRLEDALPNRSDDKRLDPRISLTRDEIVQAVRDELAVTIEDVLARRSRALFLDREAAKACMPVVREVLKAELGYSDQQLDAQEKAFVELAGKYSI